jgi:hypothetical protein
MDVTKDLSVLPMKIVLLVADIAYRVPGDIDQFVLRDRSGTPHFPGKDDQVGRYQRFDAAPRLRLGRKIGVHDGIGDTVANLVRMALRHGLAGKDEITLFQDKVPFKSATTFTPGTAATGLAALSSPRWFWFVEPRNATVKRDLFALGTSSANGTDR